MNDTRTANVKKNILWGNLSNMILSIVSFMCRTVFIYCIGAEYLGVSGLFTNVLGMLSFSELGIGTAINFSLYKPIAEKDTEKVKSLMQLYKIAYRVVALVVTIFGLLLFPFLKYLLNTEIPMSQINVFYLIFLFNTVSSYFVTYKTSYVSALQKEYILTNINLVGQIVMYIFQIIFLYTIPSYLVYILVQAIIGLVQKICTVIYINKKYPILIEKDVQSIDPETKNEIWKNVKALIIHKVGDVSIHQTDNIIISMFINTLTVGLVSNYTTLNAMVSKFTNTIFNSFTASLGNLIAKENIEKQREIFQLYDFIGFWIYGFVCIAFITLVQPFITLWIGEDMLIDNLTMILYFTSLYLAGQSLTVYNFKIAAGRFDEDKWVAFVQAIVNIVVSIIAVKLIGLPGVYVGTIVQRLIVNIVRPIIVNKYVLQQNSIRYFIEFLIRGVIIVGICFLMNLISRMIMPNITIISFIIMVVVTAILPNFIILAIYYPTRIIKKVYKGVRR